MNKNLPTHIEDVAFKMSTIYVFTWMRKFTTK